ncbi:MAG: YegS/Rv2252/BmrU family lipid kinase [candidate division KSB1 bacterium]|nr:YegS/Rv2252/BmrU family lipid kinase [candidate division KSB1 bacterium]
MNNPRSGFLKSPFLIRKTLELSLMDAPFEYEFHDTRYAGHAHELAKEAVELGFDAVVSVGGDGTTNEIGSALLYSDTALGIIPLGSGNGLARGLSIPLGPVRAVKTLINGRIRTMDAGNVNGNAFFIVTGVGLDASIGKEFNDQQVRGLLPYFTIGIREFFRYKHEVFTLKFDHHEIAVPALFVTIANLKGWGGGAIISPEAELDDGLLDICAVHRAGFWYTLFNLPRLFLGGIEKIQKYSRYQAKEVTILREKPGPFHFDGETRDGGTKIKVTINPNALKVIVP